MSGGRRAATALVVAVALVVAAGGVAAAHANHGGGNASTDDGSSHTGDGGDETVNETGGDGEIPWFPIITAGLFLLAIGIMAVRRVIESRQDGGAAGDEGDGDAGG